ncbi:MAG: hypothetical protein HRU32_15505 [Rhodobacteraceae bacterium]|nr:hypothetical protein [Paracoccaceae bacterium]
MDITALTAVFGWMLVVNLVIYTITAGFVILARDWVIGIQSRTIGLPEEDWNQLYVDYLGRFKLYLIFFNIAPYLALRLAG